MRERRKTRKRERVQRVEERMRDCYLIRPCALMAAIFTEEPERIRSVSQVDLSDIRL